MLLLFGGGGGGWKWNNSHARARPWRNPGPRSAPVWSHKRFHALPSLFFTLQFFLKKKEEKKEQKDRKKKKKKKQAGTCMQRSGFGTEEESFETQPTRNWSSF